MKEFLKKNKFNILIYTILYLVIFIILKVVINLFELEFMNIVYNVSFVLIGIGFLAGIIQFMIKSKSKSAKICVCLYVIPIIVLLILFWQLLALAYIAYFPPEHVVEKNDEKMVGYVKAFLKTEVNYYDYYNPIIRGKKLRIVDNYGNGGFDPFEKNREDIYEIKETMYYNDDGVVIDTVKNDKSDMKVNTNDIISDKVYDITKENSNKNNYIIENDSNYENVNNTSNKKISNISSENVIYEKSISDEVKIRVVNLGAILAQRSIVRVEKSSDNGNTWIIITDEFIQIHNGAKFVFIDENIGFINDFGLAGTNGEKRGLMFTTDGGKTYNQAKIIYPDYMEEDSIFIEDIPYKEDEVLKVKMYTTNNEETEKIYYEFISDDNGKTWEHNK